MLQVFQLLQAYGREEKEEALWRRGVGKGYGVLCAPALPLSPHEALDGQPEPLLSDSLPD